MFDSDNINWKSRRRYINDIYLLAAVLLSAIVFFVLLKVFMPAGDYVSINISLSDGTSKQDCFELSRDGYVIITYPDKGVDISFIPGTYPVAMDDEDAEYRSLFTGPDGEECEYNILKIKNNAADMISASCPDKICVKTKAISKAYESIVCLPHCLTISIIPDKKQADKERADTEGKTDAVTW